MLKDALEQAFLYHAAWLDLQDEATVHVNTDYGLSMGASEMADLLKMRAMRELSQRTLWLEAKRRAILSPTFDPDQEEIEIAAEGPPPGMEGMFGMPGQDQFGGMPGGMPGGDGTGGFAEPLMDILMQRGDGMLRIYDIDNYQVTSAPFLGQVGTEWHFKGVGDFNGDGTSDILWRRDDGIVRIYDIVNDQVVNATIIGQVGNEWHVVGIGDFNGDHSSDLLWQRSDGTLRIYDIVNNQVTNTQIVETLAPDTHVVGFQDYTGDGTSDLLLRHDDGTFQLQHIANNLVTQTVTLGQVGNEWHII